MATRWLRSLRPGGAMILGYHRIAAPGEDPLALCVRPDHFDEQLAVLETEARPVPLAQLVQGLAAGALPMRTVAVTFDDGYVVQYTCTIVLHDGQRRSLSACAVATVHDGRIVHLAEYMDSSKFGIPR